MVEFLLFFGLALVGNIILIPLAAFCFSKVGVLPPIEWPLFTKNDNRGEGFYVEFKVISEPASFSRQHVASAITSAQIANTFVNVVPPRGVSTTTVSNLYSDPSPTFTATGQIIQREIRMAV